MIPFHSPEGSINWQFKSLLPNCDIRSHAHW